MVPRTTLSPPMPAPVRHSRLHFRRYQLSQIAGDGVLVAVAYFLAFQLRLLDEGWVIPDRFLDLFLASVGFVVVGKVAIFYAFGL